MEPKNAAYDAARRERRFSAMASLRDTVKDYQDELRDGIAWVAF